MSIFRHKGTIEVFGRIAGSADEQISREYYCKNVIVRGRGLIRLIYPARQLRGSSDPHLKDARPSICEADG